MPARTLNNLIDRKIKSLVRAGKKTAVSDGDGLTLTISGTGYAAWVLRYRYGGRQREVTIGSLTDFSLASARAQRTRLRKLLANGTDPARQKIATIAAQAVATSEADSFEQLARLWFEKTQLKRLQHPEVIERVLNNYLNPRIGKMSLADIKPAHIIDCLEQIIDAGAPTVANDARRHIKKIFDYGIIRGDIEINPAAQITHEIVGHDESTRHRHLSLGEIRKLRRSMESARDWFGRDNEIAALLLLLLGIRKSELIKAQWSEFDLDRSLWTIPKSRIKTRSKHGATDYTIPLPHQAVDLFRELKIRACGSAFVLPARRRGTRKLGHMSPDTLNLALSKLDTGMDDFTVHDLRRTFRSQLSAIGVPFAIAERCLNHKLPGQGEIYDRHDFLEHRRNALQQLADVFDVLLDQGVTAARDHIGAAAVVDLRLSA